MRRHFHQRHCIIPPVILKNIARNGSEDQRRWALNELQISARLRGQREIVSRISLAGLTATAGKRRTVYDAAGEWSVHGEVVRAEGDGPVRDIAVNEAWEGSGATYDFFDRVFGRNSIDGNGMHLDSTVHYGQGYSNAFWNGMQMVYGDGDGELFNRFTSCLEVIGHELTHGVTQFEAGLQYEGQAGALNEHFSDVFGTLVKQHARKQTAEKADWLIGAGLFTAKVHASAVRSMKNPGTAYDDPVIGRDPQPAHMDDYVDTSEDDGGVHTNSGIPNRAFCALALQLGGKAWETAGRIWYVTLRDRLRPSSDFADCAAQTHSVAGELYGSSSDIQKAVREAWASVGIAVVAGELRDRTGRLPILRTAAASSPRRSLRPPRKAVTT